MKIVYELQGIFKRFNSEEDIRQVTLSGLCNDIRSIATMRGYRQLFQNSARIWTRISSPKYF